MDLIGIEPMTSSMPFALKKKGPSCTLVFDPPFLGRGREEVWGKP